MINYRHHSMMLVALKKTLCAAFLLTLCGITAIADDFVVEDVVISDPAVRMFDFEFSPVGSLIAWQDPLRRLWIAEVDENGAFYPVSGTGLLIDTGLAPAESTGNGPEWAFSQSGLEIIYSKIVGEEVVIARARRNNGAWVVEELEGTEGKSNALGTVSFTDPNARIVYLDDDYQALRNTYWREVGYPDSEAIVPERSVFHMSWIKGQRAMVTIDIDSERLRQCFRYDIDTGVTVQISDTPYHKRFGKVWDAPEGGLAAFCLDNEAGADSKRIDIYRSKDSVNWRHTYTITPPSLNFLYSPEYFTWNGKSYLVFATVDKLTDLYNSTGEIWIAGIDRRKAFMRRVCDATPATRLDPESFATDTEMFVYYTEKTENSFVSHRCATGLGPRQ